MHPVPVFVSSLPTLFRTHKARRNFHAPIAVSPLAQRSPQQPPSSEEDASKRFERIQSLPSSTPRKASWVDSPGQLIYFFRYVRTGLNDDIETALSKPTRIALASSIAILFGFFSATSAATIIGSVADWDPLAAFVLIIWTELFTKFYYSRRRTNRVLQLINAFKIGLIYGMTVDAFKLST